MRLSIGGMMSEGRSRLGGSLPPSPPPLPTAHSPVRAPSLPSTPSGVVVAARVGAASCLSPPPSLIPPFTMKEDRWQRGLVERNREWGPRGSVAREPYTGTRATLTALSYAYAYDYAMGGDARLFDDARDADREATTSQATAMPCRPAPAPLPLPQWMWGYIHTLTITLPPFPFPSAPETYTRAHRPPRPPRAILHAALFLILRNTHYIYNIHLYTHLGAMARAGTAAMRVRNGPTCRGRARRAAPTRHQPSRAFPDVGMATRRAHHGRGAV